jgi:putative intracellular protease/amidase
MQRRRFGVSIAALGAMAALGTSLSCQSIRSKVMSKKKILFVVTSHDRKGDQPSGYYLAEVTHPHEVLAKAGYAIDFVSPKGGKAPVDGFDLNDPINAAFWNNPELRGAVEHTKKPSEVKADDYVALFFAGGHAAMWDLPTDAALAKLAGEIYDRGGVVAAVCHGPAGLVNVKLANGQYLVHDKDVAAFTNDEERAVKLDKVLPFFLADKLTERGARHHAAGNFEAKVVVSERLVTGQNPASAKGVGEAIARLLGNAS